jgi:hypothetical protein
MSFKSALFILVFIFIIPACSCQEATRETISTITSTVIGTVKGVTKGVEEGIDEGRKEGPSLDDAIIVTNGEELKQNVIIADVLLEEIGDSQFTEVTVVFENNQDMPVRISGLGDAGVMLLINDEGYNSKLISTLLPDITIYPKTKEPVNFKFQSIENPVKFRIWLYEHNIE